MFPISTPLLLLSFLPHTGQVYPSFADADLIGLPIRITLGNRSYKEGKVEVKFRSTGEETSYYIEGLVDEIKKEIEKETKKINDNIVEKEGKKN